MKRPRSKSIALIITSMAVIAFPAACLLHSQAAPASQAASPQAGKKTVLGADSKVTQPIPTSPRARRRVRPVAGHSKDEVSGLRKLEILPSSISLTGPTASQRLVVEGEFADGHQEDLTSKVKVSSLNSTIVSVDENNFAQPRADGQASLVASFQGRRAIAQAEVKDSSAPVRWSFRNQVLPVMTKVGCNSGACHGAAAGKNGFKLTLRGYDPELDYFTLTRQALARRTVRLEPARSLILLKPTLTIQHGGGQRFPVGSPEYQVLAGWIAAGMPPPRESDPRIQELEVLPPQVSLRAGSEQQILVRARFSDGHVEDVTRWAKYTSGDDSVANVDQNGHVKMRGCGEAPVTVWYLSRVAFARVSVPFPTVVDPKVFRRSPRHNYIDDLVLKKLETLHIPPSRPTTDAEFLRRAFLDAAGILPTPAEVEKFLADPSPQKRSRLIEVLISRPEFVDYWAYKWSDLLLASSQKLSPAEMWSYYNWIRASVASNKPWDQFARQIVTASGSTRENGAANYFAIQRDPIDVSENLTKAFLGQSITCAHCHNHPLEKWTQQDYYAMANLFSRVRLKTASFTSSRRALEDVTVFSSPTGEVDFPRLGHPLPPKPLDAPPLALDSTADRRAYFARWLTSPQNPYFARALVNRVWRNFMGRGLVEAVDDIRETNPPTNQELFDALSQDFVKHGFDVQYLIRAIMNSATYQTASEPSPQNIQDDRYYSHYIIRRLPAEVLLDAISQVTQVPEKFEGYPAGMRALQLPDTQVDSYFLTVFGRPVRQQTSESERQSQSSITQALHVINGETLNAKLRDPSGAVGMLLKLGLSDQRIVEYLFLSAFSRYPTDSESATLLAELRKAEEEPAAGQGRPQAHRTAIEDLFWATLTSKEFFFEH